jgi:5-methylthioadenosine/S-adenosylhomocysteine deaminase
MVDGRVVVRDGVCLGIAEDAVLAEIRSLAPEFLAQHGAAEELSRVFAPTFAEIHRRCCSVPLGINRYSGDEVDWVRGESVPVR